MLFSMWIAGYWPVSDFRLVLKALLGILAEFLGSFYADHVRFNLSHPYIDRLLTLLCNAQMCSYFLSACRTV